ncbi:MAG: hypothetical protein KME13_23820 [Myxacorys californica WJT36-NPBG1]|nr:hypothetical protein [Myxacorys californica WJT36-NPBG1]
MDCPIPLPRSSPVLLSSARSQPTPSSWLRKVIVAAAQEELSDRGSL